MTYESSAHPEPTRLDRVRLLLSRCAAETKLNATAARLRWGISRPTADRILGWRITTVAIIALTLLAAIPMTIWVILAMVGQAVTKTRNGHADN